MQTIDPCKLFINEHTDPCKLFINEYIDPCNEFVMISQWDFMLASVQAGRRPHLVSEYLWSRWHARQAGHEVTHV